MNADDAKKMALLFWRDTNLLIRASNSRSKDLLFVQRYGDACNDVVPKDGNYDLVHLAEINTVGFDKNMRVQEIGKIIPQLMLGGFR